MALLSRCWADEALAVVGLAADCYAAVSVALAVVGLAVDCCVAVSVALAVVGLAVDCYAAPCLLSCRCCDVLPLVDVIFLDSRAMLPCRWTAMPVSWAERPGRYSLAGVLYSISAAVLPFRSRVRFRTRAESPCLSFRRVQYRCRRMWIPQEARQRLSFKRVLCR